MRRPLCVTAQQWRDIREHYDEGEPELDEGSRFDPETGLPWTALAEIAAFEQLCEEHEGD